MPLIGSLGQNLEIMQQVARINRELEGVVAKCQGPIEQTMQTQAALVASEIKSVAPVDETSKTPGALKDSVRLEEGSATAKRAFVLKIKAGGTKTRKTSKAGNTYDFARAVEFSTQDMPARPFFFPIWRARRKEVRLAVKKAIKTAVKDVFK